MGGCLRILRRGSTLPAKPPRSINLSDVCPDLNEVKCSLDEYDPKTVPTVPHKNQKILAKIVKVYDGDTCTCIFEYGDAPLKLNIRVFGIDAPEIRGSSPLEKQAAYAVRDYLSNIIFNKLTAVQFLKWDKYGGRVVGNVFMPTNSSLSISDHLLAIGAVKPYNGGRKEDFTDGELREIIEACS